ncbi:ATP-dependent Clp protease adaptor ClpS [Panacibacter sp. DH6]|uniref:ATP-dependent Clp protease adaptor ClpS n=1 Tax=Panacibacter microcysteis TaxID=2793269 RepID=A0A931GZJ3_9BACT|nr:ATP-dependent Clp protease adaptor ClpS [Panacibacter microcysteis]MBG9378256.1 ATP-dependent Clp protease adaptor ClpS [Panacibacter microcysteis]
MSTISLSTASSPLQDTELDVLTAEQFPYNLVVWNDDVNTFDWVIQTLVEVCEHTEEQAEQCSIIIHYKGKCAVKNGDYDTLKPMCNAITERNINATIEMTVNS